MIKIQALNEESDEDSDSEEEVSKEALEQIALQQYVRALELQRKGSTADAMQLLKDLLDTELLYDVKKPGPKEKPSGPLLNLKYLCYKNLGSMLSDAGELNEAIEYYTAASELDETDVTLWHRLGLVCMQVKRHEMALYAFQRGVERNPRHWPCLDKIVTLLLGIDDKEQCIITIHEALNLDSGYLRGIVYRRHIYTVHKHMKEYMEYIHPMYKWNGNDDGPIDEEKAEKLIKEADQIYEEYIEQQKSEKTHIPNVKLVKPLSSLTWEAVGNSLIHMHEYMTEQSISHASILEITTELKVTKVSFLWETDICDEPKKNEDMETKPDEIVVDNEKLVEVPSEVEKTDVSDKEKPTTDTEKVESDVEIGVYIEPATETETRKKPPARRRGCALSSLQQWEWCKNRRSGRKKPARQNDNIYDTLREMVPKDLIPEVNKNKEILENDEKIEISDLNNLLEEKAKDKSFEEVYFGTEQEERDVKFFVSKYVDNKKDIIDLLRDYLYILSAKWKIKWPEQLSKIFIKANECYMNHIDIPACTNDNKEDLLHFTIVNLLVEELSINDKFNDVGDKPTHNLDTVESLEIILTLKPHIFLSVGCLETILRQLWLKTHIHILNKCEEFALDCLYQLLHEFEAMEMYNETYSLNVINFTFKPVISKLEITEYITFLERNRKLSTVIGLYNKGSYDEVLSIIIDSFEHCQTLARKQEGEMSLDFAVQLSLILDTYWALDKVDCCFKWSFICLHEALKHYFRFTSGTPEYEKWTLTVLKILSCIEHIFNVEGLSCLDFVSPKELSQGLEDLIRIIGHQVETNSPEMPFNSVSPWIIMHFILQREEDRGRGRDMTDGEKMSCDDVPNPLMLLFIGHEQLGTKGWCCHSNGKLLFFILDTVVPRLRSPSLAKSLEQVCQYMEQCVYCLFGHPDKKKSKIKYLGDHSVTPYDLDWKRAQQLYEIFRPLILPALEGKLPGITSDTESLFLRILTLLPAELNPQKYEPEMDKYIKGITDKLPSVPPLLPYKMKDIYFLLGDYYFKKEENKMSIKYNTLDVIMNNGRLESWAQISLAIAVILERTLNSCKNLNSEREVLNPAKSAIICFKRSLQLDPTHCNVLIEYGNFTYYFHSFCSRLLKQASESLSMEQFEALEKQKEDLLDTTFKCFRTVIEDLNNSNDSDKTNEESWLFYYMLGKVAEKKNKPPSLYLNYYMQGVKSLEERNATYPTKINYNSPSSLCFEVLEFHYRIHASILKYIEQHENKPIPISVGKVFMSCIERWQNGPFAKKSKKDTVAESESEIKEEESQSVHAGNILKRSISDAGEEDTLEARKLKLESAAAKVRRSASYDTERVSANIKELVIQNTAHNTEVKGDNSVAMEVDKIEAMEYVKDTIDKTKLETADEKAEKNVETSEKSKDVERKSKEESSSSTSSSSDSSSESSSDSSSDSSRDSDSSSKSAPYTKPLPDDDIMKIVAACLDALEDCASRFSPHYKAIYRLAHYHFYYKKGKDIERCRDLMLLTFTSRCGQKLGGLFSERKNVNFFNNIWKVPHDEVERAGSFAFHMNRSVLLTMEILKEIDDHKTLLDLSLHLQRVPEPDKKYLRDSDREELAQQAFSLCVQSLKGQLLKFSQQADLKSNDVERQALKCLMLDIYKAYQRAQKQPSNSKQFTNLLIDAYKLVTTTPITENMNLVDLSMKYCQMIKQQASQPSTDKSQNVQKKQTTKIVESCKPANVTTIQSKSEQKPQTSTSSSVLPRMSTHDMAAALQNYMLNDPVLSQQTAAAISLSYLSNMSALAGYSSLQNSLKSLDTTSHSFQSEFYRQFYRQNFPSYHHQHQKKQKRAPRSLTSRTPVTGLTIQKPIKSFSSSTTSTSATTSVITSTQKALSTPLTPSMGTVLPALPPSLTANLPSFSNHSLTSNHNNAPQAHLSTASNTSSSNLPKPPLPHQQVSPGKTLQEKLAEKQKSNPNLPKNTSQDINSSLSKLPSSLTVTKTKLPNQIKNPEAKKSLAFENQVRPKPIVSDEIIVLDDD